jgi:hypothetical protein
MGTSEKTAGSIIGKWLKTNPDAVGILAALTYAREHVPIEPVAYVTKLLQQGAKSNGKFQKSPGDRLREAAARAREYEDKAGIIRSTDVERGKRDSGITDGSVSIDEKHH